MASGRERLWALNDETETYLRRLETRRWRAWWALRDLPSRLWLANRGFLRRHRGFLVVIAVYGIALAAVTGSPVRSAISAGLAVFVLWFLDRQQQVAEGAKRELSAERDRNARVMADFQASVPILATQIVEEQMLDLGWRRKPALLMGDTWTDPETGDVIDQRDPAQMWEKI